MLKTEKFLLTIFSTQTGVRGIRRVLQCVMYV